MAKENNGEESKESSGELVELNIHVKVHPDFAEFLNELIAKPELLFIDLNDFTLNALREYIINHNKMFKTTPNGLFCHITPDNLKVLRTMAAYHELTLNQALTGFVNYELNKIDAQITDFGWKSLKQFTS